MKNLKTVTLLFISLVLFSSANAQFGYMGGGFGVGGSKITKKSGDPNEFKKTKNINLEVVYTSLRVGEFNSEEEYIKKKRDAAAKKDGEAKADEWQKRWENAKLNIWPKRFEKLYNEVMNKKKIASNLKVGDASASRTLIVTVTYIEPGYNVGVSNRPAFANFEFKLVDNADKSKVIAELYINNVIGATGAGFDFDVDTRVGESFAKSAKMLATYIIKGK